MPRSRSGSAASAILVLLVVVIACGAIAYRARNPEKQTLDAAARQGAPGKFVALGDGITHYDLAGPDSGQRVVLVHGFSVPYYIWDSTAAALSNAGFRVARYDTYGRGLSDRPDVTYDLSLFDRQLQQLLDSLGWKEPVNVVGLSFGGPVTATFASRHPDRVKTLTLVDPAAGPSGEMPGFMKLPVVSPLIFQMLAVPGMADGQSSDFVEPSKWPDWADRYRVQMRYRGFGRALLSTRNSSFGVSSDSMYKRVGETHVPTLLIWGLEDKTVPFKYAADVRRDIPQTQFLPVEHAGHLPHMERTDVVNPALIAFLRSSGATSSDSAAAKP